MGGGGWDGFFGCCCFYSPSNNPGPLSSSARPPRFSVFNKVNEFVFVLFFYFRRLANNRPIRCLPPPLLLLPLPPPPAYLLDALKPPRVHLVIGRSSCYICRLSVVRRLTARTEKSPTTPASCPITFATFIRSTTRYNCSLLFT